MRAPPHRPPRHGQAFQYSTVLLLGWGALAFGGEYAWAYAPLLVLSVTTGALGSLAAVTPFPSRALIASLCAIGVGLLLQMAPLSSTTLSAISPAAIATDFAGLWAQATMRVPDIVTGATARTLSIAPDRTLLGLAFLAAFAILLIGSARGIGAVGPERIARGIVLLGVVAAMLEMVQRSSGSEMAYGFWSRPFRSAEHVPFINRNHTAGWLVMALSLAAGSFIATSAAGLRAIEPDWRHRLLWWSTPRASAALLIGLGIGVMSIGIVATTSRSGLTCLFVALVTMGAWMTRRYRASSRRVTGAGAIVLILAGTALSGPIDDVLRRFEHVPQDASLRLEVWEDTVGIIQDFPLTGSGLNTYGIAMLRYQTIEDGSRYIEAHNDYLQLAAEGGLLLGIPIVVSIVALVSAVRHRFREAADDTTTYWLRAGAATGLFAIALQSTVDFTLQMPGAAALFVVLAAIAIHRPTHVRRRAPTPSARQDAATRLEV